MKSTKTETWNIIQTLRGEYSFRKLQQLGKHSVSQIHLRFFKQFKYTAVIYMVQCYGTCMGTKLCWDVPRGTHTYIVNNLLAANLKRLRNQALSRYVSFYRSLLASPCKEVAVVARMVGRNASTTTGLNLLN